MENINESIRVFSYQDNPITFSTENGVMINATEMAKPFGRICADWLKTEQAKRMISTVSELNKINSSDLVKVIHGNNGGTWMHKDVALVFAQWLSPEFYYWCNKRTEELLTTGATSLSQDDEDMLMAKAVIAADKKIKLLKQQNKQLEGANEALTAENRKLAPKAQYTDNVLQSDSTYTITEIAKEMGMRSATALTNMMIADRIVYRQSGRVLPYANYSDKGYFKTSTAYFTKSDGSMGTNAYTVITETGRVFLHYRYNKEAFSNVKQ